MAPFEGMLDEYFLDGMPHKSCIAREHKKIGIDIKTTSCGTLEVVIFLEIQKSKKFMAYYKYTDECKPHTALTLRLVENWKGSNRVVIGDSAFSSVSTLQALLSNLQLYWCGPVKQAHSFFPKDFLNTWHDNLNWRTHRSKSIVLKVKQTLILLCMLSAKLKKRHHVTRKLWFI